MASPNPPATATTPTAAPVAIHAAGAPGRRLNASSPAMAPAVPPASTRKRNWRMAGPRRASARSTGDSRTWRTSAASTTSGPPRPPERKPMAHTSAMPRPTPGPPWWLSRLTWSADTLPSPVTEDSTSTAMVSVMPVR